MTNDGDSDTFVCPSTPDDEGKYFVATGANSFWDPCGGDWIGCDEFLSIPVSAGESYVLRTYNWIEAPAVDGWFSYGFAPAAAEGSDA